jgi:hypothetical protein
MKTLFPPAAAALAFAALALAGCQRPDQPPPVAEAVAPVDPAVAATVAEKGPAFAAAPEAAVGQAPSAVLGETSGPAPVLDATPIASGDSGENSLGAN